MCDPEDLDSERATSVSWLMYRVVCLNTCSNANWFSMLGNHYHSRDHFVKIGSLGCEVEISISIFGPLSSVHQGSGFLVSFVKKFHIILLSCFLSLPVSIASRVSHFLHWCRSICGCGQVCRKMVLVCLLFPVTFQQNQVQKWSYWELHIKIERKIWLDERNRLKASGGVYDIVVRFPRMPLLREVWSSRGFALGLSNWLKN